MRGTIVAVSLVMLAGCAQSRTCIDLLEKAESKYRDALVTAKRAVPDQAVDATWKTVLSDFGDVQGYSDESRRSYQSLKRADPDRNAELRKNLEKVNYFQRLDTVYACSLRLQGIALQNIGSSAHASEKKQEADLAAREAEARYNHAIDCGYPGPKKP